jgi:hypothetical protein
MIHLPEAACQLVTRTIMRPTERRRAARPATGKWSDTVVRVDVVCLWLSYSPHQASRGRSDARVRLVSRVKVASQPGRIHRNGASCVLRWVLAFTMLGEATGLIIAGAVWGVTPKRLVLWLPAAACE